MIAAMTPAMDPEANDREEWYSPFVSNLLKNCFTLSFVMKSIPRDGNTLNTFAPVTSSSADTPSIVTAAASTTSEVVVAASKEEVQEVDKEEEKKKNLSAE